MLKTLSTLLRGSAAAAEEELADRHALPLLDAQIRDAAAGIEAGKRALALAMAREEVEGRRLAATDAALADLEARAVLALQGGREDLATEAAAAILAGEADRDAAREAHRSLQAEVAALRAAQAEAGRRLAVLRRGRDVAGAAEAVRRLRATRLRDPAGTATLADAEATLARLRARQAQEAAADAALATLDAADAAADGMAAKLGAAGFGPRGAPGLPDILARLRAKAAAPAPTA